MLSAMFTPAFTLPVLAEEDRLGVHAARRAARSPSRASGWCRWCDRRGDRSRDRDRRRGARGRSRAARTAALTVARSPTCCAREHQRPQPVLAQRARVGGERIDHRARLEEVGRIEAERDAALHVDAAGVEVVRAGAARRSRRARAGRASRCRDSGSRGPPRADEAQPPAVGDEGVRRDRPFAGAHRRTGAPPSAAAAAAGAGTSRSSRSEEKPSAFSR